MASVEEEAKSAVWNRDTELLKNLKDENKFLRQELSDLKAKMQVGNNLATNLFAPSPPIEAIVNKQEKSDIPATTDSDAPILPPVPEDPNPPQDGMAPPPPAPPLAPGMGKRPGGLLRKLK
jgi:type IV secretory pathway VirB10-like protein